MARPKKQFFYYTWLLLVLVIFIKCNQSTPLKIALYENNNFNDLIINKINKKDSTAIVSIFDSLKHLLKINEIGFYAYTLRQIPSLLFSYSANKKNYPLYMSKPSIDEIFLLQYAAIKDMDGLFMPIENTGKTKTSLIDLFEQNPTGGYQCFKNVFSYNNLFLKDSLHLSNTTIEGTKENTPLIKTDNNDLIKFLSLTCNRIVYGLEKLNQAFVLKDGYEQKMPIGNWYIQNYAGAKLYWRVIEVEGNNIFILLMPGHNTGILCYGANINDYGWIEDIFSHEKLWRMKKAHCQPIGNENINVFCDTTIVLQKGNYNLVYVSDDSHAYMNWFDPGEYLPFYGIKIFREEK